MISGSAPNLNAQNMARDEGVKVVVDTCGDVIRSVTKDLPWQRVRHETSRTV
jgi:hypothetical protein